MTSRALVHERFFLALCSTTQLAGSLELPADFRQRRISLRLSLRNRRGLLVVNLP
jgi:hypothetical protein